MVRPAQERIMSIQEDTLIDVAWDAAEARVISELNNYKPAEIGFIASPFTTLEDNFVLKKLAGEVIGSSNICYIPKIVEGDEDDFLLRADKTPNSRGLEILGIQPISEDFISCILNKKLKLLYVIHDSIIRLDNYAELVKNIEVGITHISNFDEISRKAMVIFPASTYAEANGTLVNFQGRVQRIKPAVATLETERLPGEFSVSRLDKFGAQNDRWTQGSKYNARPAWKVITQIAKALGKDFGYETTEDVFDDICRTVSSFEGMTYEKIGTNGISLTESIPV
jgi:NADH-quinone oxidoreductase subunit G